MICVLMSCTATVALNLRAAPIVPDSEEKLERLKPILEKLRGLDGKTYGLLNGLLKHAEAETSLFQEPSQEEVNDRFAKLEPILQKLQRLDSGAFKKLTSIMNQVEEKPTLMQEPSSADGGSRLLRLQPVLEKLRNLDSKAFGMINNLIDKAALTRTHILRTAFWTSRAGLRQANSYGFYSTGIWWSGPREMKRQTSEPDMYHSFKKECKSYWAEPTRRLLFGPDRPTLSKPYPSWRDTVMHTTDRFKPRYKPNRSSREPPDPYNIQCRNTFVKPKDDDFAIRVSRNLSFSPHRPLHDMKRAIRSRMQHCSMAKDFTIVSSGLL